MVDCNESVMHHQDDQFEKLIQDARTRVDNRLMKWSENIKKLVRYFCIKVNMKNRWFIYVYLKNQHMLYITMECLQSQPGIVLIFLLTQMKKKKIPVNQIMRSQLLHIIDRIVQIPSVSISGWRPLKILTSLGV